MRLISLENINYGSADLPPLLLLYVNCVIKAIRVFIKSFKFLVYYQCCGGGKQIGIIDLKKYTFCVCILIFQMVFKLFQQCKNINNYIPKYVGLALHLCSTFYFKIFSLYKNTFWWFRFVYNFLPFNFLLIEHQVYICKRPQFFLISKTCLNHV